MPSHNRLKKTAIALIFLIGAILTSPGSQSKESTNGLEPLNGNPVRDSLVATTAGAMLLLLSRRQMRDEKSLW